MNQSFRAKGGWWVTTQFALMLVIVSGGLIWNHHWTGRWTQFAGSILLALGAWAGIAGAWTLGRNRTAYPVPKADAELIRHGIYAHIRHPLYTSLILLGLGWSLCWASTAALIATAMLAVQLRYKAVFEEQRLVKLFADYPDYQQQVPRFIPGFRQRQSHHP